MISSDQDYLMDLAELSRYLRISRSLLYKYAALGKVPFYRIGNRLRFKYSEIQSWLAAGNNQEAQV